MPVPSETPVRSAAVQAVRDATATRHRQVERRIDVRASFGSAAAYGAMLSRLFGFHAPLEAELRGWPSVIDGVAPLPRRDRLAADLVAVGVDPSAVAVHTTPVGLPRDAPGRVGALYVIEGSALGGAILARLAERRLGLTAATGAAFFHGDAGPGSDDRWALVLAAIDVEGAAGRLDAVIAGARRTFDRLDAWLASTA